MNGARDLLVVFVRLSPFEGLVFFQAFWLIPLDDARVPLGVSGGP